MLFVRISCQSRDMLHLKVDSLPDPTNRFDVGEEIATGSWAKVYKAIDKEANGKTVAIKIQKYDNDRRTIIDDEYRILRDFSGNQNFLDFYGVYRKRVPNGTDEIWFVLQVNRVVFSFSLLTFNLTERSLQYSVSSLNFSIVMVDPSLIL